MPDEIKTFDDFTKRYHLATPPQLLGEGGFGKVYLAYDVMRSRQVAVKVSEVKGAGEAYSLLSEFKLVKEQIPQHPNIAFYGACYRIPLGLTLSDYAVMDYYPLGNLKKLRQKQPLTDEQKQDITLQILAGLQHLHTGANKGKGIIHRDLKSTNILIAQNPMTGGYIPKIGDFGISKSLSSGSGHTSNSFAGGSLYYAAPEQLSGLESIGKNADLWSWGVLTYELYTGELPFKLEDSGNDESRQGRFYNLLKQQPTPPLLPTLPTAIQEAIRRCLVFDKTKRLQTAEEVRAIITGGKVEEITEEKKDEEIVTILPPKPDYPETPTNYPPKQFAESGDVYSWQYNGVNFEFVRVEGGEFLMGSPEEEFSLWKRLIGDAYSDERPQHSVTVATFYMGKFPVTQAQYKAVMGKNPSYFKGDDLPVETVSWHDAVAFCEHLSKISGRQFRLPTEAEWEYAARGGNKSKGYKYSGGNNLTDVAWHYANSDNKTHPVGAKLANELGLYDMSGNVWEWCQDWYAHNYYGKSPSSNPQGPASGSIRLLRGGSWYRSAVYCRVAYRNHNTPTYRINYCGFRVALVP